MIIKSIELSLYQPSRIDVAWAKPVKGGFALYLYYNGKWQSQLLVDDMDNYNPDDDDPIENGGKSTYVENIESLYIDGKKPQLSLL